MGEHPPRLLTDPGEEVAVLAHVVVAVTAALVTAVTTPLVARLSRRVGAVDQPGGPRRIHRVPVPTMGGLAMLLGLFAALGAAAVLETFEPLFATTSEPIALGVGALVITAIGVADDLIGLPPTIKLAGQIVAALVVVVFGIQLVHFWVPGVEIVALSSDLGLPLTVIALVAMINAVNMIDGLDGLAAGVAGIAGIAFFLFTLRSQPSGLVDSIPTSATLVAAIVVGVALGFLVHNWHPARIFMGDTGAMLLGLLLGAAGVSYVGRTTAPSSIDFYGSIPLLIPALVLAVPFLDSAYAVVRRGWRREPLAVADRGHLHHRLLMMGHSHRRAVLILYYWSAVIAFGSVAPAFITLGRLVPYAVGAGAVGIVITALGARAAGRERARAARDEEHRRTGTA